MGFASVRAGSSDDTDRAGRRPRGLEVQEARVSSLRRGIPGPHAARAQVLRTAALSAIARREAAARRRKAQRLWGIALLIASGSVAGVFQSCAGSRGVAVGKPGDDETPLVAKLNPKDKAKRSSAAAKDRPETTAPGDDGSGSSYDAAARDLAALLEAMRPDAANAAATPDEPLPESAESPGLTSNVRVSARRALDRAEAPAATPAGPDGGTDSATSVTPTVRPASTQGAVNQPVALPGPPEPPTGPTRPGRSEGEGSDDAGAGDAETLTFGTVSLCSRVDGFGRYTPLGVRGRAAGDPVRFLAGKVNPAIVYCELDHFTQSADGERDGYQSEFTTRIELFHDDGSRQWRADEATIRDYTLTRRRDLYLVQRIDLPANLSVGRYNLKVTVRDRLAAGRTGAECETIVPIEIVADARLVTEPPRPTASRVTARAPYAGPEPVK